MKTISIEEFAEYMKQYKAETMESYGKVVADDLMAGIEMFYPWLADKMR